MSAVDWPADSVERRPLTDLLPYISNPRVHPDWQIAQIVRSIEEWGWTIPILVDEAGNVIAGHGRIMAALKLNLPDAPCMVAKGWSEEKKRAYVIADNQLALNATWDMEMLGVELSELETAEFDMSLLGFKNIALLLPNDTPAELDEIPDAPTEPISQIGDVWLLGHHRLMCGDSTDPEHLARLMNGQTAQLIHADPPYGMGKEADGILNDNIYRDDLDEFQMRWWSAVRPFVISNGSAYLWGNAPDLWRLWYVGGLADSEVLELRNEIVWDKQAIPGMASPELTQFPEASERCLFFQFGKQFLGNVNTEDFPELWEPLRSYFEGEAKAAGITAKDIKRVCGCGMYAHWFTRSQYCLIPEHHYATLASAYAGHFLRPWPELKAEWARVRGAARDVINGHLSIVRAYFDNAHDIMHDVWQFPRVSGAERFEHAAPKPVAMMERMMRSSLPEGGLCIEPFGGCGSTLIAAERTQRICYAMELHPAYVDLTVQRWEALTGAAAVRLDR